VSRLTFNLPLNSTSLGQVSFSILRELFKRKEDIHLFPIGGVDISTQSQDKEFFEWIQKAISSAAINHKKTVPIFKLWHLNGSLESFSNEQILLSFYEVDSPTSVELNIVNNNKQLLLSSNYAVDIFKKHGADNVNFIPLAFDQTHFKKKSFSLKKEGIQFGLFGKLEPQRKRHLKVLQSWIKKYGNKQGYFLNCAIYNNFLDPNLQSQIIQQALKGEKYWNVNLLGYMPSNEIYNDFLNNTDIVIAMSGGEGWGLPEFQTVALGKHCIGLNAHAYKDWMTSENTVLVEPNSKIPCYDNIFFKEGSEFNQGNIFDWDENEFINSLDLVENRYKQNPINIEGLKLQDKFTYTKMVDAIIKLLK
jgi:glycosyltransferase involved in cell wall biosynthesis